MCICLCHSVPFGTVVIIVLLLPAILCCCGYCTVVIVASKAVTPVSSTRLVIKSKNWKS